MNYNSQNLLAQNPTGLGTIGENPGFGPFPTSVVSSDPISIFAQIISFVIGFITLSAAIYFIIQFMIGAFQWLSSSGDKGRLSQAQDRLTHAFIGFLILIGTFGVMSLLSFLTGFDFLLKTTTATSLLDILKGGGTP